MPSPPNFSIQIQKHLSFLNYVKKQGGGTDYKNIVKQYNEFQTNDVLDMTYDAQYFEKLSQMVTTDGTQSAKDGVTKRDVDEAIFQKNLDFLIWQDATPNEIVDGDFTVTYKKKLDELVQNIEVQIDPASKTTWETVLSNKGFDSLSDDQQKHLIKYYTAAKLLDLCNENPDIAKEVFTSDISDRKILNIELKN